MLEYIRNELLGLSDKGNYAAFTSALIPGCDNVIGVRQPVLKKYARQLVKDNEDFRALLTEPDIYHEETLLRGYVIGYGTAKEKNFDRALQDLKDYVPSDMYVLTNESKLNGAACILYENVLYDFAQKLGADLYILPSSVHEVILLPKLSMFEKDELVNMVKEVNTEGVAADEVLSDHVYEYNRTERLITM